MRVEISRAFLSDSWLVVLYEGKRWVDCVVVREPFPFCLGIIYFTPSGELCTIGSSGAS
jgi:hypothetical protein